MKRLTYRCSDTAVSVGVRVVVELGANKKIIAIVANRDVRYLGDESKLKNVIEVIDRIPVVSAKDIEFLEWVASYYMIKVGDVVRSSWGHLFSADMSRLKSVRRKNKIAPKTPKPTPFKLPSDKNTVLLHSFTKIDIASLVVSMERSDKYVLVLAPTHQKAKELEATLSQYYTTSLCTTQTTTLKRAQLSAQLATGLKPEVLIGTRTALWLNHTALGAVILTNEESYNYRTAAPPYYSTRDCATMLASIHKAQIILTSSFPSVESYYNANFGQWGYIEPEKPAKELRSIVLERGGDLISKYTKQKIADCLEEGRKVILVQNRRGIASYIECEKCGDIPECPNCSTSLNLHRTLLGCHYCGYSEPIIANCKLCGGKMLNRGRGTQQIEEQLYELFPQAHIARLDSDNINEIKDILNGKDNSWNIAIGTTMLLNSQIWDNVGVISILNVDNMLSAPDFRVEEDAYRTIGELSLKCRESNAEFIVQSSRLDHRAVTAVIEGDYHSFYRTQIIERKTSKFPPHSRMILFEFRGKMLKTTIDTAVKIENSLRTIFGSRLSPIYQPSVERQRGEYIIEMTLKIERGASAVRAKELVLEVINKLLTTSSRVLITLKNV